MSSPPAGPVKRLGPKFAVINDVDRELEEELDLAGSEPPKHVDDEIDELLSDNDNDDEMDGGGGGSSGGMKGAGGGSTKSHPDEFPEWTCRWDDCFRDLVGQEALVEHVQTDHIGQGRDSYICDWEACARKGQKQASRHSLITHCRAHTGERPYTCQEPECHKTFTRSDALSKHLRSLHGIIPDLPPKKKAKETGQASSPPGSAAGSSPIAYKRSEVDDIIAEALLSPEDEALALPQATAPAPASPDAPAAPVPNAERPPVPAIQPSNPSKPPRTKKPSGKKARPKASASASTSTTTPALALASASASSSKSAHGHTTTKPIRSNFREQPLQLPRDSAFYHSDLEELATDVDLGSVLPRLCNRERFWNDSEDDEPALDLVRDKRRRLRRTPPRPPYGTGIEGDDYEYDSLDEEIPLMESTQRIVAETSVPENPKLIIPVMSRSKWQARYMMGKAKVMLLSEENEMRRKELERTLREEMELDQRM